MARAQRLALREAEEQANGVAFLRRIGFKVAVTSNRRASSNSPGIPDVIAVGRGIVLQWECKAAGGKLSPKQLVWGTHCLVNNAPWCFGPFRALQDYLATLGIIA